MNQENFFQNKKVLVAGGAGFIGTNILKKLLPAGARIRATYHNKKPQIKDSRIEYIRADLTLKRDCADAVRDREYVFMCAANTSGAGVIEKTPLVHVTPNVVANAYMLEAACEAGVKKFLWLSSNTVYPVGDYPMKEEDIWNGPPFEKYFGVAWMKRFGEILCEMYSAKIRNPMKTVVIRPANAYGEYDDFEWETSHVIPALIRKTVERHNPIEVWGDGRDIKDLIYVKDLAEGILLAMEKMEEFQPLNIGTGRPVDVREALNCILKADNYQNARISFNSSKPTMIPKRLLDVSRAKELLGFESKTSLQEGLRQTIEWYKENQSKNKPTWS